MAKNSFPVMQGVGSGALGKVVRALLLVAVIVLIVKFPADAALLVQNGAGWLGDVIGGVVTFFRALGQ